MKRIVLLSFLLVSSIALSEEPKFHYNDCVKIDKGFYEGCIGTVVSWFGNKRYDIEVSNCKGDKSILFNANFGEEELKPSNECGK